MAVSLLSPRGVRRLALIGCVIALLLTALTMVAGVEIKGARRWISLPGMSIQPSEFLKPCFAVVAAWLLAEGKRSKNFPGMAIAFAVFARDPVPAEEPARYRHAGGRHASCSSPSFSWAACRCSSLA